MPYSIQPGDIIEVRLNMRLYGQRMLNVLHWRNGEDEVPDAQTALQDTLDDMFDNPGGSVLDAYVAGLSADLTLLYADAQVIYPLRRAYERKVLDVQCSGDTPALPPNVSASITKRSTFAGAGSEGRIAIPGMMPQNQAGGEWTLDGIGVLNDIAAQWIAPLTLGTFTGAARPIIYHRTNPNISVTWETLTIQPTTRVQRRRTVGLGE